MNIAIIGTGNIARGLARVLGPTRHGVVVAGRELQDGADLAAVLSKDGITVQAASVADAIGQAEVVILAVPFGAAAALVAGQDLEGRILVDVTNPVAEDYSGLTIGYETSAAEQIAAAAPGARIVKAFNTVFAQVYDEGLEMGGRRVQTFVASDDEEARSIVADLARDAGFDPVETGPLSNARYIEPLAYLNIQFGYMLGRGTQIAPAWLSR